MHSIGSVLGHQGLFETLEEEGVFSHSCGATYNGKKDSSGYAENYCVYTPICNEGKDICGATMYWACKIEVEHNVGTEIENNEQKMFPSR